MADDILDTWKHSLLNNQEVKEVNSKICIGGRLYSKDTETTFPVKILKDQEKRKRMFYTVGEIFFFLQNYKLPHHTYVKKAMDMNVGHIKRPDRNAIKNRLAVGSSRPTLRSSKTAIDCNTSSCPPPAKKMKSSKAADEGEEEKPRVRTYSRKKPLPSSRSSNKRNSATSQVQSTTTTTSLYDEVSKLQTELQNQQSLIMSMTIFLRDFLGVTPSQVEIIQGNQNDSSKLKKIASAIQSQCSCSSKKSKPQNTLLKLHQDDKSNSVKFCYKAEKHPSRGWELVKKRLFSVVNGSDTDYEDVDINDQHKAALEACLSKVAIPLKHALSVLISQMRDFNKSPKSFEQADLFCEKIVKDCLVNAVDSFRDAFECLFQSVKDQTQADLVEQWVTISEAELRKLLLSLVKSLQTLRDIPNSDSKNLPSTLFHFPEPVFSMALNPAKVTHSVVLEMYIRIGLAELRQIVTSLVGFSGKGSTSEDYRWNKVENASDSGLTCLTHSSIKQGKEFCEAHSTHCSSDVKDLEENDRVVSSSNTDGFNKEFISGDALTACLTSRHSAPELDKLFPEVNGKSRNSIFRSASGHARRSSESDSCQYNIFKASLGNTMVSSFKKQIQEKIQASSINLDWN